MEEIFFDRRRRSTLSNGWRRSKIEVEGAGQWYYICHCPSNLLNLNLEEQWSREEQLCE